MNNTTTFLDSSPNSNPGNNQTSKPNLLKIATIIVFVFPMLPLLLASIWSVFMLIFSTFTYLASTPEIRVDRVFLWLTLIVWFMGGTAGAIALIRVFQNKRTKATLWLMIYGMASYTIIAVPVILAGMKEGFEHGKPLTFVLILYVIFTLFVIAKQLLLTKEVLMLKK